MPRYVKKANSRGGGRPTTFRTSENADAICQLLEQGMTIKQIAVEIGHPEAELVRWGNDREGALEFSQRYARARIAYYEALAEQLIEISDEIAPVDVNGHVDTGWVQQQRLRSDNRKWLLSKALPKRYGDKVTQEITGDAGGPLLTRIELVAVPPRARIEDSKVIEHDDDE